MPWGVTAVLVRSEHRTTAEEHDAFSGPRLLQLVSLAGRLLATGRAARVGWRVARAAFGLLVQRSGHGGSTA